MIRVTSLGSLFSVLWIGVFGFLSGCHTEMWKSYSQPDYGTTRADRMCHPFAHCVQGRWVQVGKSEIDAIVAYADCEDTYTQKEGRWSEETVAMGSEIARCMNDKGFVLEEE